MPQQQRPRIVVGVDGSSSSIRALTWAIRQARLTGGVVDAICAWQYPVSYGWAVTDDYPDIGGQAAETLDKAITAARAAAGETPGKAVGQPAAGEPAEIRAHVLEQNPARALIVAAEGAELLVVGSRGHGGFVGALLGSVSQHCVHHAPCSVLVIRGDDGSPS